MNKHTARLCNAIRRWIANWNRGTLTASDGLHLIARLHELHDLRDEVERLEDLVGELVDEQDERD